MNVPPPRTGPLLDLIAPGSAPPGRVVDSLNARVKVGDLADTFGLDTDIEAFCNRSVMILTRRQLTAALALIDLDGVARRAILCTPDLSVPHLRSAFEDGEVDIVVTDDPTMAADLPGMHALCCDRLRPRPASDQNGIATEWVLFTSGSTGRPKLAAHTLSSLVGPLVEDAAPDAAVWSTFYDIRRYGGLQILLRALVGGGSMILSEAAEPVADFLARAGAGGVTHISGTPSHWRRALMSQATAQISPRYVRLSGEVVDQAVLDQLRQAFPAAEIGHAFASTEAGVAFAVRDGLAGFPASLIEGATDDVELRVESGSLRIRSSRTASAYLGAEAPVLRDASGFVDTGDLVELRGERYQFVGRRGGIINVGGLKVHPEAVEAVINQHDAVLMSRVSARSSPITGAIVVADVVLAAGHDVSTVEAEIMQLCRRSLASYQVPGMLRQVAALQVAPSGKLERRRA